MEVRMMCFDLVEQVTLPSLWRIKKALLWRRWHSLMIPTFDLETDLDIGSHLASHLPEQWDLLSNV
jgi:hypothetical protein